MKYEVACEFKPLKPLIIRTIIRKSKVYEAHIVGRKRFIFFSSWFLPRLLCSSSRSAPEENKNEERFAWVYSWEFHSIDKERFRWTLSREQRGVLKSDEVRSMNKCSKTAEVSVKCQIYTETLFWPERDSSFHTHGGHMDRRSIQHKQAKKIRSED